MIDNSVKARTVEAVRRGLSKQQKEVFIRAGDRLVTACPGAGKTRGIAARASLFMSHGERVALTTFTNVGADEIRRAIETEFHTTISDGSFVGTLHGFLLRYVYRPFAAEAMRSKVSPSVRIAKSEVKVPAPNWSFPVDDFKRQSDGSLRYTGRRPWGASAEFVVEKYGAVAERLKEEEAASGMASVDDALYWCLKVLQAEPGVAQAVASRFDEIVIDEAQDTSKLQSACLKEIVSADALRSLILVGDLDQSIYSFQGASKATVMELVHEAELSQVRLTENHRSPQLICNVTARLRTVVQPDTAVGPTRADPHRPRLLFYDATRLKLLPLRFAEAMERRDIALGESAVIARGNELLSELSGATRAYYDRNGLFGALVEVLRYPRLSAWRLHRLEDLLREEAGKLGVADLQPGLLRDGVMSVLGVADGARNAAFEVWSSAVADAFANFLTQVGTDRSGSALDLKFPQAEANEPMASFLKNVPDLPVELATVHAVKGRSLQATLVVADHVAKSNRPVEWVTWRGFFEGNIAEGFEEEFRILYVALTRASRRCFIALPDVAHSDRTLDVFESAGFDVPRA